jgi:hypothetical protein
MDVFAGAEKEGLPRYTPVDEYASFRHRRRHRRRFIKFLVLALLGYTVYQNWPTKSHGPSGAWTPHALRIDRLQSELAHCSKLRSVPQDPSGPRERNARYVDGQKAVLIRNATVWTGEPAIGTSEEDARAGKGYSWAKADIYLEHGLIKQISPSIDLSMLATDHEVYDAKGRMLTAGIVDMHSHAGESTAQASPV